MHDFRKTRIIMWDIGKNKPNISIHLQIYGSYRTFPIYQSQNVRIFLLMIANSIIWNLLKTSIYLKQNGPVTQMYLHLSSIEPFNTSQFMIRNIVHV